MTKITIKLKDYSESRYLDMNISKRVLKMSCTAMSAVLKQLLFFLNS